MTTVIDASLALAWCFEDEASPAADAILDDVARHGAFVPLLWRFEVANALLQAERKQRITLAEIDAKLGMMDGLPISVDNEGGVRAWRDTLALARSECLTVYDAAYLELALRKGSAIATKDRELIAAAERTGVAVSAVCHETRTRQGS